MPGVQGTHRGVDAEVEGEVVNGLDLFRCLPLRCTLTRSSCAKRHLEVSPLAGSPGVQRPTAGECRGCVVGEAHARGERPETWPDGAAITERPALSTPVPTEPSPSLRAGRSVLIEMRARTAAARVTSTLARPAIRPPPRPKEKPVSPNRRNGAERRITLNGRTDNLTGWGEELGLTGAAIAHRLARGWTEEEALTIAKGYSPERLKRTGRPKSEPPRPGAEDAAGGCDCGGVGTCRYCVANMANLRRELFTKDARLDGAATATTVGQYVRACRLAAWLSLRDVATALDAAVGGGVDHVFVGEVERDRRPLPRAMWASLKTVIPCLHLDAMEELAEVESKSAIDWLRVLGFAVEDAGMSPNGRHVLLVDAGVARGAA